MLSRCIVTIAFLLVPELTTAQDPAAGTAARLDSIAAAPVAQQRAVGLVAAVVQGNDTLLFRSYGKADLEWDVAMPTDAMLEVASVAKQFTAAAVLQLRDAGKLSLDDGLSKWLPDFDTRGHAVPLRRLLDHTSGIMSMTELPEFGHLIYNPLFPRDSAYALIRRQAFQFAPGTAQVYNNSAYFLLGLIIEKASGVSYEEYLEKNIFEPLGMSGSMYCNSAEVISRRAHGYIIQNDVFNRAPMNVHTWPYAAGSICSTAGDLITWLRALHGGRVLSPGSYAEMTTPARLIDGSETRYGMGVRVYRNYGGQRVIGHGGSINGFKSEANWYPDAQLAVVVLVNSSSNLDPGDVATEMSARLLPWSQPELGPYTGDPAPLLGRFAGAARGGEMVVEVTQTAQGPAFSVNGSPPRPLPWREGLSWQGGTALLTFHMGSDGRAAELHFDAGNGGYYVLARRPQDME